MGRPTDYSPDVLVKAEDYLQQAIPENMAIPTVEGLALLLNVNRDTLYEWAKVHSEFSDTLAKLKNLQKQHLTMTGIFGGKEVNATIIALLLKVNHDMVETSKTDVTSKGEQLEGLIIVTKGDPDEK